MLVVDTSAWIEWLLGSAIGESVSRELPQNDQWVVPTIVQYELDRWLTREKSQDAAASAVAFSMQLVVTPLSTELAIAAADYSRKLGLAMADSIIYATAMDMGADLLTCDQHFAQLPHVIYFPKAAR